MKPQIIELDLGNGHILALSEKCPRCDGRGEHQSKNFDGVEDCGACDGTGVKATYDGDQLAEFIRQFGY